VGEAGFDFLLDVEAFTRQQCGELPIDPVALVHLRDEIQDKQAFFAFGMAKSAPELL
jgi:hypothetical protein